MMGTMPSWRGAAHVRNLSSGGLGLLYRLQAYGAHHMGSTEPLVIVCSSEAVIAGAVIQAIAPRPVHVVPNAAMSAALPAAVLAPCARLRACGGRARQWQANRFLSGTPVFATPSSSPAPAERRQKLASQACADRF